MASVNKVILIGRCGKDPETSYMPNGDAVSNVSLATSYYKKSVSGEQIEDTEWHRVEFYRRMAEVVAKYVKKSTLLYVEGRIKSKRWKDKTGVDRYSFSVVAERMQILNKTSATQEDLAVIRSAPKPETYKDDIGDFEDDIPFS